jgi:opacity protein-like surface antigen
MKKKFLKKSALAAALMGIAFMAHAGSCFDGVYAGLSAGASFNASRQNMDIEATLFNPSDGSPIIEQPYNSNMTVFGNTAPKGALYFGYGKTWENFYLGTELFADISRYHAESSGNNTKLIPFETTLQPESETSIDTTSNVSSAQYGIDLRPGILVSCDTLLYARIGVAGAHVTLNSTAAAAGINLLSSSTTLPLSTGKSVAALRLGVGAEHRFCRLGLRCDYIFTNYGNISTAGSSITEIPESPVGPASFLLANNASAKVTDHTVMLGLSYYF